MALTDALLCISTSQLNEFLKKIDTRYEVKIKREGMLISMKNREIGSLSSTIPPPNAPTWTINSEWDIAT